MDDFKPAGEREGLLQLNKKQLRKLLDKGFCYMEVSAGNFIKIGIDDLCLFEDQYEILKKKINNE